jgi:hypothetical protein
MPKHARSLVVALFLILVYVADVIATHAVFTSRYPGANDFYRPWSAAHLWWTERLSPYSEQVTARNEIGLYGRRAQPGEDPGSYAYPLYTIFVIAPLVFLPYSWAEAVWLVSLEFALLGSVIGAMRLVEWRASLPLLVVTSVWTILFYHSARAILLGQFAVAVFALNVATLLALRARRDIAAGVLVAVSTIKPQMVFMWVPLLLFWAVARKRWRLVAGFASAMMVLCGASFAAVPSWVGDFVAELLRYPSYTAIGSPVWVITRYFFPVMGAPGEMILSAALVVWMLAMWLPLWRDPSWPLFLWVVSVTLVVTNLVALRTATTNYVVLLIPLVQILAMVQAHWKRMGAWVIVGLEVTLLIGLWVLFLATVAQKFEHPIMYLPLPVGLAIALAVWRKRLVNLA